MRPGWVQGNSDGPLVPMVRLVPMEKHPIPMVLLVQNKFAFTPSKNALIIIMNIPRSISQPRKTSSLLHQLKTRHNSYEYSSFYRLTTQNKFAFTQSRNALIVTKRGRPIYLALIISQGAASITNIVRTLKLKGNASLSCSFCLL